MTDYERVYADTHHALGEPTKEFVEFFDTIDEPVSVLDIGCGQGRDALFIARRGHSVFGVDLSATGIGDMLNDAALESLDIRGEVADVREYEPERAFDVVLIDRTLHMLSIDERRAVLSTLIPAANKFVLIADEPSNIPEFEEVLSTLGIAFEPIVKRRGFLFVKIV